MLKIEEINRFDKFQKLEPIWNDLLSQSDSDFPFLTHEWLTCWWKVYGKKSKLLILLAKDGDDIAGIAPLMITKTKWRGLPVRAITFIANRYSNRSGFILLNKKKEAISQLLEYITDKYNYDIIWLDFVPKGSDSDKSLRGFFNEKRIRHATLPSNVSPYISLDSNWEKYHKSMSKSMRKDLRYSNNRLRRNGKYEVVRYKNKDIDGAMARILEISRKTWKHKDGTAIGSMRENTDFYTFLAKAASSKNWLDVMMLSVNDRPAAFNFMLDYKGIIYDLKMGYDEKYYNLCPGNFLKAYSIRDAFERRYKEFDMLGNNEPHKMRWTSTCREHNKYWIFGKGVYGRALDSFESFAMPAIRKLLKR